MQKNKASGVSVKPKLCGKDSSEAIKSLGNSINRYQLRKQETPECVFDTKNITNDDGTKIVNSDDDSETVTNNSTDVNHTQMDSQQLDEVVEIKSKQQQQIEDVMPSSQQKMQAKCTGDLNICTTANWKASLSANNNSTSATFTLPYQMTGIHTSATVVANRTDNANSTILQCTVVLENTPSST